jgi:phage/plasmid-associated DNA primase
VNASLAVELRAEAAGILAWAVRGCCAWQRDGLTPPPAVLAATREYERDSDQLGGFLDEACERESSAEVGAAELFDHYRRWAGRQGLSDREQLTATMFGRKLGERFEGAHTRSGKVYKGIKQRTV